MIVLTAEFPLNLVSGDSVDNMDGLQSLVPGHLSALFLLHLQVIVDWMQVKVLELDPNLVGS